MAAAAAVEGEVEEEEEVNEEPLVSQRNFGMTMIAQTSVVVVWEVLC